MPITDFSAATAAFEATPGQLSSWKGRLDAYASTQDLGSCMKALAASAHVVAGRHPGDPAAKRLETVAGKALDWMASLAERLEKANRTLGGIGILEYRTGLATSDGEPVPGTGTVRCLVYNRALLSDTELEDILSFGIPEQDRRVIVTWPENVRNVFPDTHEDVEAEKTRNTDEEKEGRNDDA